VGTDSATITFVGELSYTTGGRAKKVPTKKATMKLKRELEEGGLQTWKIESIQ
jgi:hypothetical protein